MVWLRVFSQYITSSCIPVDSSIARPVSREVEQKTCQPPHRTSRTQKDEHLVLKSHITESEKPLELVKNAPHPQSKSPGTHTDSDTKSDPPITKKRRFVGPTLPPPKKKSADKDVKCKVSRKV